MGGIPGDAVHVAIDGSSAVTGGGVRYLREVLPRLLEKEDVRVGPVLLREGMARRIGLGRDDAEVIEVRNRAGAMGAAWGHAVARARPCLVYSPTEISVRRYEVPLILALRNALLGGHSHAGIRRRTRAKVLAMRGMAIRSKRTASAYVAISEAAKRFGVESLAIDPRLIEVIYHGGPSGISGSFGSARGSGRFLFVGDLYRHKRLDHALDCLRGVEGDWTLDVVGGAVDAAYCRSLQGMISSSSRLEGRVRFRGYLDGDQLRSAYENATCLLWTSAVESFGHPLVEAHTFGLDVIASDTPVNREIAGGSAHYFDLRSAGQLQALLAAHVAGRLGRGSLPRNYSWDSNVDQLLRLFRDTLGSGLDRAVS